MSADPRSPPPGGGDGRGGLRLHLRLADVQWPIGASVRTDEDREPGDVRDRAGSSRPGRVMIANGTVV
ncbi:hypothetical protein [Embleya sp. AB8]|uniref:hypothetical protein n=1 Tax=Embleya sp. AB8 TaxID=3156304 RepID=UPI003C796341